MRNEAHYPTATEATVALNVLRRFVGRRRWPIGKDIDAGRCLRTSVWALVAEERTP